MPHAPKGTTCSAASRPDGRRGCRRCRGWAAPIAERFEHEVDDSRRPTEEAVERRRRSGGDRRIHRQIEPTDVLTPASARPRRGRLGRVHRPLPSAGRLNARHTASLPVAWVTGRHPVRVIRARSRTERRGIATGSRSMRGRRLTPSRNEAHECPPPCRGHRPKGGLRTCRTTAAPTAIDKAEADG